MLSPDYYYDSVFMIPYHELQQRNIKGLIFDLDNTLAPFNIPRPPAKIAALVRRLRRMGFIICLLTNNTEKRMRLFNEHLEAIGVHSAMKPLTGGIKRAMRLMGTERAETAIIGDQLFSDVWGGRNARIMTILVKPIGKADFFTVRMKRGLEGLFIKAFLKKAGVPAP